MAFFLGEVAELVPRVDFQAGVNGHWGKGFGIDDPSFWQQSEEALKQFVSEGSAPEGAEWTASEEGKPHFFLEVSLWRWGQIEGAFGRSLNERNGSGNLIEIKEFEEPVDCLGF